MAKVLIAEDDPKSRELLTQLLEAGGHRVVPTRDGAEALARTDREQFDLIVSDWMMPNLTGIELCEALKARKNTQDIPVIMVTTKKSQADMDRAYAAGVDEFLSKPFDRNDLEARIATVLSA